MKQTKIVATVGPSCSSLSVIKQLINSGVDVFRINFSHSNHEVHTQNIQNIRLASESCNKVVAIMGDLQGPKIRVGKFKNSQVALELNAQLILDCDYGDLGDSNIVSVDYKNLANDLTVNDTLLLDDGKIALKVNKIENNKIFTTIIQPGILSNNKGINKLGGGLTAPALTNKDIADIEFACKMNLDYLAVSFVRDISDIELTRSIIGLHNGQALIIAKIERAEAVENMEELVKASDGIMVARGDLAVEVGDAQVPGIQKRLLKATKRNHKIAIVATQMLESMISSPVATRAEISDIANAVLDGTDAVMLSAETASGNYPIQAVATMSRACIEAEKNRDISLDIDLSGKHFDYIDQAIAMSALFSAYHLQSKAIIALTTSGATALWLSRINIGIPIYAITNSKHAAQRMALYNNVEPILLDDNANDTSELLDLAKGNLIATKKIDINDIVLVTCGEKLNQIGRTNIMKIIQI